MKNVFFYSIIGFQILISSNFAFAQVVADFETANTSACETAVIQFTSQSTGGPTNFEWDFGDGTTSTQENPVHFYGDVGTFTVRLTVSNTSSSDSETKSNYISIYANPVVNFSVSDTIGCSPLQVRFSDQSTVDRGSLVDWNWDFGNGDTSSEENPINTYSLNNSFDVFYQVIDEHGCSSSINLPQFITSLPSPEAIFSQSDTFSCIAPKTISFTNSSNGSGLNYEWDFGNGNSSVDLTPSDQVYNTFGDFTNTLIVTNNLGCSDSLSLELNVETFQTDFSSNFTERCIADSVKFTDLSSSVVTNWLWDFGDGTISSEPNPTHLYSAPGTYSVELTSSGEAGVCNDNVIKTNFITIHSLPTVDFTSNVTSDCQIPFEVEFTDNTSNAVSWEWDFGDGNISNDENPSNSYNLLGDFNVQLSVIDQNGCSSIALRDSFVSIIPPSANFNSDTTNGCAPLLINFTDLSFSNEVVNRWNWDFGNGDTSIEPNPSYTYSDTGSYSVTLIIENVNGCIDTLLMDDFIQVGQKSTLNFSPLDAVGCHPYMLDFYDSSSVYSNQWYWNFGDGGTSVEKNPIHTYRDTGYFDVTFAAAFNGCWDSLLVDSVVEVLLPKAAFTALPIISCSAPLTVDFTDNSVGADKWTWQFGDGVEDTTQNTSHTYASTGFYMSKLIVENFTTGCLDSVMQLVSISEINAEFDFSDSIICKNEIMQFTDFSTFNSQIDLWDWDFGDGEVSSEQNPEYVYRSAGIYTVSLTVTDTLGCSHTIEKTSVLEVKELPVADFASELFTGCAPLLVNFSDRSTGVSSITEWQWRFGDGNTSISKNTSNIYLDRGLFDVTLTVTDTFGCSAVEFKNEYIQPTKPFPGFTLDSAICNNASTTFTDTSSGTGINYEWNFGDGTTLESSINPSHIFYLNAEKDSILSVSLTLTDVNNCDSTISQDLLISIPIAAIGADSLIGTCPPHSINFSDSSSLDVIKWVWDFGDNSAGSILQNPANTYTTVGDFDVSLSVENSLGCTANISESSLVVINGPTGNFTSSIIPLTCFKGAVFESDTQNSNEVLFVFGDGVATVGDSVTHFYDEPGNYNVVMQMTDASACVINVPGTHFVRGFSLDADFSVQESECAENAFEFTNQSSGQETIVSWFWSFGNGDTKTFSTDTTFSYFFTGGDILTTLTVRDENGCESDKNYSTFIPESIETYNVFSPNGDGKNDFFEVETCSVKDYKIEIFDRWGKKVFESFDKMEKWDGLRNGNEEASSGTYFYVIEATSYLDNIIGKKGYITLFR
jgi:gliding motility-associated-like protein